MDFLQFPTRNTTFYRCIYSCCRKNQIAERSASINGFCDCLHLGLGGGVFTRHGEGGGIFAWNICAHTTIERPALLRARLNVVMICSEARRPCRLHNLRDRRNERVGKSLMSYKSRQGFATRGCSNTEKMSIVPNKHYRI